MNSKIIYVHSDLKREEIFLRELRLIKNYKLLLLLLEVHTIRLRIG